MHLISPASDAALKEALHRVWGFSDFRPLQREAMHAVLQSRDSVVVLPTGGGKSLCFQAPAIVDAESGFSPTESPAASGFPPAPWHGEPRRSVEREGGSRTTPHGVAIVVSPLISLM